MQVALHDFRPLEQARVQPSFHPLALRILHDLEQREKKLTDQNNDLISHRQSLNRFHKYRITMEKLVSTHLQESLEVQYPLN